MQPSVLVIGGATASGKSKLAMQVAEHLESQGKCVEILCADSITVFRGMEIGSTKPSPEDRSRFPHHLLDLCSPTESFTAGDFIRLASPLVESLLAEQKIPLVVGGSGFYLRALLRGMASPEENPEKAAAIKAALMQEAETNGWDSLYGQILRLDPNTTVHPNDHYRVLRALQFMHLTGEKWSEQNTKTRAAAPKFPHRYFYLSVPKELLRERIEIRTKNMLAAGLLAEVRGLLENGVPAEAKPLQSVGYKECVQLLQGEFPAHELEARIVQSTVKLAKAQSTWFRGEELATALEEPALAKLISALA